MVQGSFKVDKDEYQQTMKKKKPTRPSR